MTDSQHDWGFADLPSFSFEENPKQTRHLSSPFASSGWIKVSTGRSKTQGSFPGPAIELRAPWSEGPLFSSWTLDDFRVALRAISNHFYVPLEIAMLAQRAFGEKVRQVVKSFVLFFRRADEFWIFVSEWARTRSVLAVCRQFSCVISQ
jgi:hypothetical protein